MNESIQLRVTLLSFHQLISISLHLVCKTEISNCSLTRDIPVNREKGLFFKNNNNNSNNNINNRFFLVLPTQIILFWFEAYLDEF